MEDITKTCVWCGCDNTVTEEANKLKVIYGDSFYKDKGFVKCWRCGAKITVPCEAIAH